MSVPILQDKLEQYKSTSWQEEESALKEILQEIALAALSRTDFFKKGAFQGGTALRIFYHLDRFSEDLDFLLKKPDPGFEFQSYASRIIEEFQIYGIAMQAQDKTKGGKPVQKLLLKQGDTKMPLEFRHYPVNMTTKKIRIKMEIDTNPPAESRSETKYHDFPFAFGITVQDLPSLFAGKSHALLCRQYTKGRDWYDFLWYVARRAPINFPFLSRACEQNGPWEGKKLDIDKEWYLKEMEKKILETDWQDAKREVASFVRGNQTMEIWQREFFLDRLQKLGEYL